MEPVIQQCGDLEVRLESTDGRRFTISVPAESMQALVDTQNYRWNEVLAQAGRYMDGLLDSLRLPDTVAITDVRSHRHYERTRGESFLDAARLPRGVAVKRAPDAPNKTMQLVIDATALGADAPALITNAFQTAHVRVREDIGPIRELDRFGKLSGQRAVSRGW